MGVERWVAVILAVGENVVVSATVGGSVNVDFGDSVEGGMCICVISFEEIEVHQNKTTGNNVRR